MKKSLTIILVALLFAGCRNDTPPPSITLPVTNEQPEEIKGLELTYLRTHLPSVFKAIYFVNENTGFIAGEAGLMYKSTNGGIAWTNLNTNTTLTLNDIYFFNSNEGFAVGGESGCTGTGCVPRGAIIIHTKDGGQTWVNASVSGAERIELNSICFASDSLGFAVGGGTVFRTKDRGISWKGTKINNLGGIMMDVEFINEKKGMIACGKLLETTDGGLKWSVPGSSSLRVRTLSLLNENIIFAADYEVISKSTDFGNNWSSLSGYTGETFKLVFKSEKIGYAFGRGQYSGGDFGHDYGAINYTIDGGATWKGNNKLKDIGVIESASFPTESIGYALDRNVVIKIRKK